MARTAPPRPPPLAGARTLAHGAAPDPTTHPLSLAASANFLGAKFFATHLNANGARKSPGVLLSVRDPKAWAESRINHPGAADGWAATNLLACVDYSSKEGELFKSRAVRQGAMGSGRALLALLRKLATGMHVKEVQDRVEEFDKFQKPVRLY